MRESMFVAIDSNAHNHPIKIGRFGDWKVRPSVALSYRAGREFQDMPKWHESAALFKAPRQ